MIRMMRMTMVRVCVCYVFMTFITQLFHLIIRNANSGTLAYVSPHPSPWEDCNNNRPRQIIKVCGN